MNLLSGYSHTKHTKGHSIMLTTAASSGMQVNDLSGKIRLRTSGPTGRTACAMLISLVALMALAGSAQAATRTWAGNDGTNPTFWDIGTTNNWNGGVASFSN